MHARDVATRNGRCAVRTPPTSAVARALEACSGVDVHHEELRCARHSWVSTSSGLASSGVAQPLDGVTLARSAKDAPRMRPLALVRTGREVLERLGVFDGYGDAMRKMGVLAGVHLLVGMVVVR